MARPTSDPKTKTMKFRISEELIEEIERYSDGNVSESVRELIKIGLKASSGEIKTTSLDESEAMVELRSMAKCWEIDIEDMLSDIVLMLEDGIIERQNGMLVAFNKPKNWEEFEDCCRRYDRKPEDAIEGLMKAMI